MKQGGKTHARSDKMLNLEEVIPETHVFEDEDRLAHCLAIPHNRSSARAVGLEAMEVLLLKCS